MRVLIVTLLFCFGVIASDVASAESFEGILKWRTISVAAARLSGLVVVEPGVDPGKVFAIPPERLLSLKGSAGSGVEVSETSMYIKGSKVRADVSGHDHGGYVVMDLDQDISWMVMPGQKKYLEWTKADLQALGDWIGALEKAMEERLPRPSPNQRRQIEAMRKGVPRAKKWDVRPLGKTQTINGMQTTGYEVRSPDETTIGWVTQDHRDLIRAFKTLQQSQENMRPSHGRIKKGVKGMLAEHGLPVRVQTLERSKYEIVELIDIQRKSVPADLFVVPAGFEKTTPHHMIEDPIRGRKPR